MRRKRVKITGVGPVTPAGIGREAFWRGIMEPVSRVRRIDRFPEQAGPFIGAELVDFDPGLQMGGQSTKRMARHTQFAMRAAELAAADAGIDLVSMDGRSTVVAVGAALMDFGVINRTVEVLMRKGPVFGLPSAVASASVSAIGASICQLMREPARSMAFQSACCSGVDAVGHAAGVIARGEARYAICGGTESPLFFHPMLELKMAGLSPGNPDHPERQCRPFDLWRTTGAVGEGACVVILEPEDSPRPALAWIEGYAYASDDQKAPGSGLEFAMRLALANASIRPSEVGAINAWGPGHRRIDATESEAIRSVFGRHTDEIPAFSIKGAIGNPLGAAGVIQVAATALGFARDSIPPTINYEHLDPACNLQLSASPRYIKSDRAIINTHGISGTNACLVLSKN